DDEQAGDAGRSRDAGQILQRAQRVAVRAGDARDLFHRQLTFRDLARRAIAFDDDVDRFALELRAVDDLRGEAEGDLFFGAKRGEAGGRDLHGVLLRRQIDETKVSLRVGRSARRRAVRTGDRDGCTRERLTRRDENAALHHRL